jgi:hypothetical protein
VEIARQLETRNDVFNLNPLFEFLLDNRQNRMVQRAVARCAAKLSPTHTLNRMEHLLLDPGESPAQKLRVLRVLADMDCPAKTVPLLARISIMPSLPMEVREAALYRLGHSSSLQALPPLLRRTHSHDARTAAMARQAVAACVERAGGMQRVVSGLLRLSVRNAAQRQRSLACSLLAAALRLSAVDPNIRGQVGEHLRQLLVA